jgi:hypothetical protein
MTIHALEQRTIPGPPVTYRKLGRAILNSLHSGQVADLDGHMASICESSLASHEVAAMLALPPNSGWLFFGSMTLQQHDALFRFVRSSMSFLGLHLEDKAKILRSVVAGCGGESLAPEILRANPGVLGTILLGIQKSSVHPSQAAQLRRAIGVDAERVSQCSPLLNACEAQLQDVG